MNEKDKKKMFRKNIMTSIIITIAFLIGGVVLGRLIEKYREKMNEIFDAKLEKINIPSPIVYYEKIDNGQVIHNPIKDNHRRYGDEIIDQKEIISSCFKLEKKTLLTISSDAVSYIDTVKLNKYGRHRQAGGCKKIGYILTRIFIDGDRLTGESESAYDEFIPELSASCSFSVELKPETYKIRVETLYCGYLARPNTTVVISGIRAEPINLKDLLKSAKEKEKKSASHGVKCPEAVTGQRQTGLTPDGQNLQTIKKNPKKRRKNMSKKQKNEPEMIKDSSVTLEVAELKQKVKELEKKLADYEKRLKALEAKLA